MGRKAVDLTGQRFGRLEVLGRAASYQNIHAKWVCQCECGNLTEVMGQHLRAGRTKSCGCALANANAARLSKPIRQKRHLRLVVEHKKKPMGVMRQITYGGKTQGLSEWAREMGLNFQTIQYRLDNGWDVERALTTPSRKQKG